MSVDRNPERRLGYNISEMANKVDIQLGGNNLSISVDLLEKMALGLKPLGKTTPIIVTMLSSMCRDETSVDFSLHATRSGTVSSFVLRNSNHEMHLHFQLDPHAEGRPVIIDEEYFLKYYQAPEGERPLSDDMTDFEEQQNEWNNIQKLIALNFFINAAQITLNIPQSQT